MKRKDMVDMMESYLDSMGASNGACINTSFVSDRLLGMIEDEGMLPPLRDKIVDGKFVGYSNMQVPEWDEE